MALLFLIPSSFSVFQVRDVSPGSDQWLVPCRRRRGGGWRQCNGGAFARDCAMYPGGEAGRTVFKLSQKVGASVPYSLSLALFSVIRSFGHRMCGRSRGALVGNDRVAKARRREQRCVGWQIATGDSSGVNATRQNTASSKKSNRVAGRDVVAKVVPDKQAVRCFGDRATVGETCRSGRGGQRRRAPNHATLAGHGRRSEAEHAIESC